MYIWESVLALAAIASLIMWLKEIFINHRPYKELVYPVITIVLVLSASQLYSHNTSLLDPTEQAKVLVNSWPRTTYTGTFHKAEARGIVLAGLKYLETYKHLYPDAYSRHLKDYESTDFTDSLQATYAADTMITVITSYSGTKIVLR